MHVSNVLNRLLFSILMEQQVTEVETGGYYYKQ